MVAGLKGNEAVAPPYFGIGIGTAIEIAMEDRRRGGLMRAGHKGSEAAAPPRLCRWSPDLGKLRKNVRKSVSGDAEDISRVWIILCRR